MNKPFKYEYSDIEWEYNEDHFDKWCQGMTGFPIGTVLSSLAQPHTSLTVHAS